MKQVRTQVTKTYMQKPSEVTREWHVVDAKGQILGRMATEIAAQLMGKHKPTYSPHVDGGDYVVVINAKEVATSADKTHSKVYYSHTGFPGGIKEITLGDLLAKHPERVVEKAVYNMLPKNRLRQHRMTRLKVYAGAEHPHQSQFGKAPAAEAAKAE